MKPHTTFATANNPFTGVPMPTDEPKSFRAVPEKMEVVNDPLPEGKGVVNGKYNALFETLTPGQAIKCNSNDINRVANSLRKWVETYNKPCIVRSVRAYPGDMSDKRGRVWLLPKPAAKALKRAA